MQNIKYLIILILTLALGFVYLQLRDYNNISQRLLQKDSSSIKKIDSLEKQISTLNGENQLLQDTIAKQKEKIFLLEEELILIKYDKNDTNSTNIELNTTTEDNNTMKKNEDFQNKEKSIFDTIITNEEDRDG